jgi:hypothetical protein
MLTVTMDQVLSWEPCYSREQIGTLFAGRERITALDVLSMDIPVEDHLWAVLREELISPRTLRLFAVWCARQALALIDNPDPRSIMACGVAERYTNGEATAEELAAARVAMVTMANAAQDAARAVEWDTWGVAESVALATQYAADSVAWIAARGATKTAAGVAAGVAAETAEGTSRSMARAEAWNAWDATEAMASAVQVAQLRAMLTRGADVPTEQIGSN